MRATLIKDHKDAQTQGQTLALQAAVKSRNLVAARFAVDKGADVHRLDRAELTPLQRAAKNANEPMVEFLLKQKDIKVDISPIGGENQREALSWASAHPGGARIVKKLLSAGAKVDAVDCAGRSALSYAISAGAVDCEAELETGGAHRVGGYATGALGGELGGGG